MLTELYNWLVAGEVKTYPTGYRTADRFANVTLRNQFGEEVRFFDKYVEDRAVIVNTMYTECRGSCPRTSQRLEWLRKEISTVFGNQISIVSITLDPKVDTVKKLADYARVWGADERSDDLCHWDFVTGDVEDIEKLRVSLGFWDRDPRIDGDITQHDSLLMFGNSITDRWASMPATLKDYTLLDSIRRTAGFTFEQKYGFSHPLDVIKSESFQTH